MVLTYSVDPGRSPSSSSNPVLKEEQLVILFDTGLFIHKQIHRKSFSSMIGSP